MPTTIPARFIFTGNRTNANATTATEKSEQVTRSSCCQRLRAALRAVKNTSLKLVPCLLSKEEKAERSRISEEKAYAYIKETLLNRVAKNKVKGIFRMSVGSETLQNIKKNKVQYSFIRKLANDKKEDVVHLYANILKENLKGATEKLNYLDLLRIYKDSKFNQGACSKSDVESKMKFATEKDRRNFYSSMDIIVDIYHALKIKTCDEAKPEGIARIISPLICDPDQLDQNIRFTDVHGIAEKSKGAGELTRFVLDNWNPQRAKLSILQES